MPYPLAADRTIEVNVRDRAYDMFIETWSPFLQVGVSFFEVDLAPSAKFGDLCLLLLGSGGLGSFLEVIRTGAFDDL